MHPRTKTALTMLSLSLAAALTACKMPTERSEPSRSKATADIVPDRPLADGYVRPGFAVYEEEGRLWVFRDGGEAHRSFLIEGKPAKRVTLVAAGPDGKTLLGSSKETLEDYVAPIRYGCLGFVVFGQDGRLWVFRKGSSDLESFLERGEPAKRVTMVGAGPDGKTLPGADREALASCRRAMAPQ